MRLGLAIGLAGRFSGTAGPTVFVDSVAGNDSNSGSLSEPLQTLSALDITEGMTIKLKRGSVFRETLSATGVDNVTVETYGDGLFPILDCADIVEGTWTRPDAVGNPNVWSLAIANSVDIQGNFASIWEDGVRLQFVVDRTTCNSTPGSFCITGSATGVYGASSTTFEIHASDSGNPNSNGSVYETAKRAAGIGAGAGWVIRNLRAKRNAHNNGSIGMGNGAKAYNCIAEDGVKHNWYVGLNCELYDCIVYNADLPHPDRDGWTGFVSHETNAAGATSHYERCFAILPKAVLDWKLANSGSGLTGFYAHTDGVDGHDWDNITYVDCSAEFCEDGFSAVDVTAVTHTRTHARGCRFPVIAGNLTGTDIWLEEAEEVVMVRGIQNSVACTLEGLRVWSTTDQNNGMVWSAGNSPLTITRSVFVRTSPGTGYQQMIKQDSCTQFTMTGCVLHGQNTGNGEGGISITTALALSNNSYGSGTLDMAINGNTYDVLEDYLTAVQPGLESGSVTFSAINNPVTDAANGDFTLTGASGLDTNVFGCERFPTYQTIPDAAAIAAM